MLVKVALLYEEGGRPLPRHRAVTARPAHLGKLSLSEEHDRDMRRMVRSARLCEPSTGAYVLPPLLDAVVLWISGECMTITGVEQDDVTRKRTAQSWYVELAKGEF